MRTLSLRRGSISRHFLLYAVVGGIGTVLYFGLYNGLRLELPAYAANTLALAISITFSYWGNRRFTFADTGSIRGLGQYGEFLVVYLVTLGLSNGALAILFSLLQDPSLLAENLALAVGNGAPILLRFWLLRSWVFRPGRSKPEAT